MSNDDDIQSQALETRLHRLFFGFFWAPSNAQIYLSRLARKDGTTWTRMIGPWGAGDIGEVDQNPGSPAIFGAGYGRVGKTYQFRWTVIATVNVTIEARMTQDDGKTWIGRKKHDLSVGDQWKFDGYKYRVLP